jgi:hypothetical protein
MIYEIDPLRDPRWQEFLGRCPDASVFHTPGWLQALQDTYRYQPSVITTSGPGKDLENGIVFCRVHSWLTGRRLVSVPFSDHCEPLVGNFDDLAELFAGLRRNASSGNYRYVEIRPISAPPGNQIAVAPSENFYLHLLDLRPGPERLFRQVHKTCIQRQIRAAATKGIEVKALTGARALEEFYTLVVHTRRRQNLLPQPRLWFANVLRLLGDSAVIRCAYREGKAIAGVLTLEYQNCLYYKYGASESQFHRFGAMPCLVWEAICDGMRRGRSKCDLGRSECSHHGLVTFKDRWGATRTTLSYYRFPAQKKIGRKGWPQWMAGSTCNHLSDGSLIAFGKVAYRHMG